MAKLYNREGFGYRKNPRILISSFNRFEMLREVKAAFDPTTTLYIVSESMVADHSDLIVVTVDSLSDLEFVGTVLESEELCIEKFGTRIDTIVFDTLTGLQDMAIKIRAAQEHKEVPSFDEWSWLSKATATVLSNFAKLDKTIIYLGVASPPSQEGAIVKPGCLGSFSNNIGSEVELSTMFSVYYDFTGERHANFSVRPSPNTPWVSEQIPVFGQFHVLDSEAFSRYVQTYREKVAELEQLQVSPETDVVEVVEEAVEPQTTHMLSGMSSDDNIKSALGL